MTITFNMQQWGRLIDGTKHATVRRGAIRITPGHYVVHTTNRREMALVAIREVTYKRFDALDIQDAFDEGYDTVFALRQVIAEIYPDILPHETVTVIHISEVIWHGEFTSPNRPRAIDPGSRDGSDD